MNLNGSYPQISPNPLTAESLEDADFNTDEDPSDDISDNAPGIGILLRTDYSDEEAWQAFYAKLQDAESEFASDAAPEGAEADADMNGEASSAAQGAASSSTDAEGDTAMEDEDADADDGTTTAKLDKKSKPDKSSKLDKKSAPGVSKLPPISTIPEIFKDIVVRMPDIKSVAKHIKGRKLRVATMCSGTESPLLALGLSQEYIEEIYDIKLETQHVFSCEIEPFKQAYIERNFKPAILFRDICELGDEEAYVF